MKKLDRFLILSFLGPFLATFFLVIFVLSMQFLWIYIDELVGKGLGIGVILEFLGWAACTLIPMALPLATLLASIMTMGGLGEKNELLAMKAAGISLQRIMAPLIVVSAVISVGAFFAANNLIPVSYNKIYTLREDIAKTKEEIKIPTGTFYNGIDGYTLRIERRDDESGMMYDLMIYDHTNRDGSSGLTLADSGRMHITPDKRNLTFDLYHGCSYTQNDHYHNRDTLSELSRLKFTSQQVIIALDNYTFTRSDEDHFGNEVMSKGLKALNRDLDSLTMQCDSLHRYQVRKVMNAESLAYLFQLDSAWVSGKFRGNICLDSLKIGQDAVADLEALVGAATDIPRLIDQAENLSRESFRFVDPLRCTDIERYRKFTLSVACFVFFFIGAPLGAIIRKGGFGTPMVISIIFFLVYYVVDISGKKLAREGTVSPMIGTFISTLALMPIGAFLTHSSTQDSSLFNVELYKDFFKMTGRFFSREYFKCRNFFRKDHGRIRIVFMGTPEFAVGSLDALVSGGFDVVAVVTATDKPSGRGMKLSESAVKKYALSHNIPVLQPEKLKDPDFLAQLRSLNANLFVVVAFRMLPKEVWSMPYLGTFNLHASLLPCYRGAAPINWALINGEKMTGVTTFMIDEKIDTGAVLYQESCAIEDYDSAGSLHDKLMVMGSRLVVKTVEDIRDHRVKPRLQDTEHVKICPAPKLTRETATIDWSRSAEEINNLIRGLSPYPSAVSTLVCDGKSPVEVKIFEAYVTRGDDNLSPGAIKSDGKSFMEVRCGRNSLRITSLQLSGKKRMPVADLLLGLRGIEDYRFV